MGLDETASDFCELFPPHVDKSSVNDEKLIALTASKSTDSVMGILWLTIFLALYIGKNYAPGLTRFPGRNLFKPGAC